MGNTFISGFNPISDENGHNLDERFHSKIKTITNKTNDVYCVLISDDNTCHKYKINDNVDPELMKTYTASKLFKYIFGEVLKRYIEHPNYKNMSEEELEQICSDFAQHLKNASKVILNNDADVETDRFSVKFPNNAFAKYSDPTKIYFSRLINADTRKTMFFYFPIQIQEDDKKYHVVIKYQAIRDIKLAHFNPFKCDLQNVATNILYELQDSKSKSNCCILYIKEGKVTIEFCDDQLNFVFQSTTQFYKLLFGKIYKEYIVDERYKNMTDDELTQICSDFESYLEYFNTNEIAKGDANKKKYMFHVMFPDNVFAKCLDASEDKMRPYMCKLMDEKSKKIKYHYLPLEMMSKGKTYHAVIATTNLSP